MPATKSSVLEAKPATDLNPGETHVRLKDDPYYGKVDIGSSAKPDEKDRAGKKIEGPVEPEQLAALTDAVKEGRHALDGEEQNHVEVLTGKRLQQKTKEARPPEPDVPPEGSTDPMARAGKTAEAKPKP